MKLKHLLLIAMLPFSTAAFASTISIQFSGSIYSVGASISGDGVNVGDTVTGIFSYDTTTPDINLSADYGQYSGLSFDISFDSGFNASAGSTSIRVQNDLQNGSATNPADGMTVGGNSVTGDQLNGRDVLGYQFGLRRENLISQLWGDDFLPDLNDWANITVADMNAADWNWMQFSQDSSDNSIFDSQIRWDIKAFTAREAGNVPEPSTLALLALGLFGLRFATRKRS